MKLNIVLSKANDMTGFDSILAALDIQRGEDGILTRAAHGDPGEVLVKKEHGEIEIRYGALSQLARALGYIKENEGKNAYCIHEFAKFDTNGVMLDVCQNNAALLPKYIKKYLDHMAIMGLNTLYLYMEDSFYIPEEPYFGHMRGRYTREELMDIDAYAAGLGITVIPCVQTLAHLIDVLKWPTYYSIREDADVLLVGDERVYEFITHLLAEIRRTFRSRKIHIGMDEAFGLGRGTYLDLHGYHPQLEIMKQHLERVLSICKTLEIEPMVWSDMLINSSHGKGTGMANYYNTDHPILPEAHDAFPRDLIQVFWDYNHHEASTYEAIIARHKILTDHVVFAGACWNWNSFTTDYDKTFLITKPALQACKRSGVRDVFMTTWGDNGVEGSLLETLLGAQLFAEYGYADEVDDARLRARFLTCTGCNYDDFRAMTYLDNRFDHIPPEGYVYENQSRWLMWQDVLCGMYDAHLTPGRMEAQYQTVAAQMEQAQARNGEYGFLFDFLAHVARVLALKAEIGLKLKKAYDEKDAGTLKRIAEETLPEIKQRLVALWELHREMWFETNKAFGWEIFELRYGATILRIETACKRISDYLAGTVETLDELDEVRRTYNGKDELPFEILYSKMFSASRIC